MNLTTTVMMTLVFFLLCSGIFQFTFASNRLRIFTNVTEYSLGWEAALNKCEADGGSFVTLYDDEDAIFTQNYVAMNPTRYFTVWLGLTKTRQNVTTWSNGDPFIFNRSSVNIKDREQICEAMDNNTWKGFNCSERHSFMCYKDNKYVLVEEEKKDWCQAELYCREHNSSLVSISNDTQNQEVIEEGKNKTFWIGLLHDEWEWVDQTCSTYRSWDELPVSTDPKQNCTIQISYFSKFMTPYEYDSETKGLCSKGDMRIRVINQSATWEEALNYCEKKHTSLLWMKDRNDQEAVEQWLKYSDVVNGTFWIGLRQSILFGFWIWKDRPVSESNWRDGQPPELPFSNQCAVLNATDYKWSDEDCFHKHPFICVEKILKYQTSL